METWGISVYAVVLSIVIILMDTWSKAYFRGVMGGVFLGVWVVILILHLIHKKRGVV